MNVQSQTQYVKPKKGRGQRRNRRNRPTEWSWTTAGDVHLLIDPMRRLVQRVAAKVQS